MVQLADVTAVTSSVVASTVVGIRSQAIEKCLSAIDVVKPVAWGLRPGS
jgi:hypothetical protein